MRPLYALAAAAAILGAAGLCVQLKVAPPPIERTVRMAEDRFSMEITLTFDAAPDTFSIEPLPSVLVQFQGEDVLRRMEPVKAGQPIRVEDIQGIEEEIPRKTAGRNEFYIEAYVGDIQTAGDGPSVGSEFSLDDAGSPSGSPASASSRLIHHAVRIRLFRGDEVAAEKTLWADPGEPVKGTVELVVSAAHQEHDHEHSP